MIEGETLKIWNPYVPSTDSPWNERRVVHLHRRAVFGASWNEVQRDLASDPQSAVTRILEGQCRMNGVTDDFINLANVIGSAAAESGSSERLKAWWILRILFTSHPLEERLTIMWHNHFATSNLKVNDLRLMQQQNNLLRRHAMASFGEMLRAMSHDPALLLWLDAPANKAGQANENLARELMELFTIGVSNYKESDVKEVARALTGWTVNRGDFHMRDKLHDTGQKTILGQQGSWNGDDVVRILLEHPATARRLAWRLTNEFLSDGLVDQAGIEDLANGLSERQLDIRWVVETIIRSEVFFSEANIAKRIVDPITFLIAPLRALECWRDRPSTLVLAEWLSRMGLDLFYPPNVGGWNGGKAWLSTRSIIARTNYAAAIVEGRLCNPSKPFDLIEVVTKYSSDNTLPGQVRWLASVLCNSAHSELIEASCKAAENQKEHEQKLSQAVVALLSRPEAHFH